MENSYLAVIPGFWKDGVTIVAVITPRGEQSPHTYLLTIAEKAHYDYFCASDITDRQIIAFNVVPSLLAYIPPEIQISHVLVAVGKQDEKGRYLFDCINPQTCRIERCEMYFIDDFFHSRELQITGYPYFRRSGT